MAGCAAALLALWLFGVSTHALAGRNTFSNRAVGGVIVGDDGLLQAATVDQTRTLAQLRRNQLGQLKGDVAVPAMMRKVSLRRLQEAIKQRRRNGAGAPLSQEMEYLAGLTRIQFVFVYPEEKDVVLVGPAEAVKAGAHGHMVGAETGQPVLQLDHLLVALRTAASAARQPITCSIDPTQKGIAALQKYMAGLKRFDRSVASNIGQRMGLQNITITGVPANSDFARTMVAADYRMKRLAMGMDRSKIIPSYLQLMSSKRVGLQQATPRWWLAPNYEALLKDEAGLAWELRGQGVKVMTEDSILAAEGKLARTKKPNATAGRWADMMTQKYTALSEQHPIFGELRNVMDMAVIGALIVKQGLAQKAGLNMSVLLEDRELSVKDDFPVPKQVKTTATVVKKGSKYIISASGGVEVASWQAADKTKNSDALTPMRKSHGHLGKNWWWN